MLKAIKYAFITAVRAFLDGVKVATGVSADLPEMQEDVAARATAVVCFAGAALVRLLPFPGASVWSESLFAVGLGLWNYNKMRELT